MFIEAPSKPKRAEYLLATFAFAGLLPSVVGPFIGSGPNEPFFEYFANRGVRAINAGAIGVDALILFLVLFSTVRRNWSWAKTAAVASVALLGTVLCWLELWYGSTFYYGEVRDKQGLPFFTNNFGVFGSFCFLAYIVWRIRLPKQVSGWSRQLRTAATILLPVLEWVVIRLVSERWLLWQS